jgi:hypothetical protein
MARDRLIEAISILGRTIDFPDAARIAALETAGFSEGEAHRVVVFVPSALALPVLEEFGVAGIHFTAPRQDGSWVDVVLDRQPEYRAALRLGREQRKARVIDPTHYEAIVGGTAEIDVLSNAQNEGQNMKGVIIATALVSPDSTDHIVS